MRSFLRIGITGGIGAGKSAVTARLRELGAAVIDADEAARAVVEPGTEGLRQIAARFGSGVIGAGGALNRPALAAVVFGDEEARAALNGIVHPLVREWMLDQEKRLLDEKGLIFWDVPLLIETGMAEWMDRVWLICAPEEERIRRIMARDGASEEAARKRIESQMPEVEKRRFADEILENTGALSALYARVDALYREALSGRGGIVGTEKG